MEVKYANVKFSNEGKPLGSGLVAFHDVEAAKEVMGKLQNSDINGRFAFFATKLTCSKVTLEYSDMETSFVPSNPRRSSGGPRQGSENSECRVFVGSSNSMLVSDLKGNIPFKTTSEDLLAHFKPVSWSGREAYALGWQNCQHPFDGRCDWSQPRMRCGRVFFCR